MSHKLENFVKPSGAVVPVNVDNPQSLEAAKEMGWKPEAELQAAADKKKAAEEKAAEKKAAEEKAAGESAGK